MENTITLNIADAHALIMNALVGSGTSPENAGYFTDAILDTELSGLEGTDSTGCNTIALICVVVKWMAGQSAGRDALKPAFE